MSKFVIPHSHAVSIEDRVRLHGGHPYLIWFTGLSGSGKSTLANGLEQLLYADSLSSFLLDGDNIRSGLNQDLDFSDQHRKENIRRISEVSKLFLDAGLSVLTAFISPFKEDRLAAKNIVGADRFIEVYVDCPLEVCEARDVKGLYKKARAGEIKNFTGIDSPFEEPAQPDIQIDTANHELAACLEELYNFVRPKLTL